MREHARGVRRLDAALSKDPLKNCDATENASGSLTQSAEDNFSRKGRKERKEMEDGNGVRKANVVTLCLKRAYQTDEAENLLWM